MQSDYVNKTTIIVGILAIIILILLIMNYQKTNQINALKPTEAMKSVGGNMQRPYPGPHPGPHPGPQPGPHPGPQPGPHPGPYPGPYPRPQPRPHPRPDNRRPVQPIIINYRPPIHINKPVVPAEIVLYYAEWCGHCKNFMPVWQQFEERNKNRITIKTVNCDENKSLCSKMDIQGFPTVRLYKSNREVVNFEGNRSVEGLEHFINQYV